MAQASLLNDDVGLIQAHLLCDPKKKLSWKNISTWKKDDGPLWLHLDRTSDKVEQWLLACDDIEPEIIASLLRNDTRPRFSEINDSQLLLIVKGVNLNDDSSPEEMIALRMWTDGTRFISLGFRPIQSVKKVANLITSGKGPLTTDDLLLQLLKHLDAKIEPLVYELSKNLDEFEESLDSTEEFRESFLADLQIKALMLKRHLVPQRAVLRRMHKTNNPWLKKQQSHWREFYYAHEVYVDELAELNERISMHQEVKNQQLLRQSNQTMYVLSIVAAIFLPLSFLTGLLGINVGGIPGVESKAGFFIVCVIVAVIGIVEYLFFKQKKWL